MIRTFHCFKHSRRSCNDGMYPVSPSDDLREYNVMCRVQFDVTKILFLLGDSKRAALHIDDGTFEFKLELGFHMWQLGVFVVQLLREQLAVCLQHQPCPRSLDFFFSHTKGALFVLYKLTLILHNVFLRS